jgi:hypothetical protein
MHMKKSIVAIALLSSATVASYASAALLVNEPFSYSAGPLLGNTNSSTGTTWKLASTATSTSAINVITTGTGLTNPDLAITGSGNHASGANRLGFAPAATPLIETSGTVYYSFDLDVTALTGSNTTTGGFDIALNNTGDAATATDPTTAPAKIQMRQDPTNPTTQYDMEVLSNVSATAADANWSVAAGKGLALNTSVFVVAAYSIDTGTASLWINPDPSTLGAGTAPTATETATGGTLVSIGSIIMRQSPAPQQQLAGLLVGTTWADVTSVPEPASISLIGLGAVAGLARRRRA